MISNLLKLRLHILLILAIDIAMIAMEWPVVSREWRSSGAWMLRFYTQSSNVLAMFVCIICAACEVVCLIRGCPLPRWEQLIRYVSTCCLMVTMIVAACILVPMDRSQSFRGFMLEGGLLYLHTLCPLVMLAGCLLHGGAPLTAKHAMIAVVPTVVYGIITLVMNAKRIYSGPYFFFRIYRQPWYETVMWFVIIIGGNFVVSWLLGKLSTILK